MKILSGRAALAVAALAAPGAVLSAPLPLDVLDTADVNYAPYLDNVGGGFSGISDARSLGTGGGSDHFDDAVGFSVNGTPYGVSEGTAGANALSLAQSAFGDILGGLDLWSTGPYLRQIFSVTNTGGATARVAVEWLNNTGNDSGQRVIGSSDGDRDAETTDSYVVTADSETGTNNEVNGWVFQGFGGRAPTSVSLFDGQPVFGSSGDQGFHAIFDLTVAPGETQSLMFFTVVEGINQDGIDASDAILNSAGVYEGLTANLSAAELSRIQNFGGAPAGLPDG